MPQIAFLALIGLLVWGAPALAGPGGTDFDGDGILDSNDNCSIKINARQDDTDGDDCGNLCDCDYNQDGKCTIGDFGAFSICFGKINCAEQQHVEPISAASTVNVADFGYFSAGFGAGPGPSGTTSGTVACP